MADKVFVNGLIFKAPRPTAPSFVKGSLSVKVEDFTQFMAEHAKNGWVNIDLKESKGGKFYAELNTWEKGKSSNDVESTDGSGTEEIGAEEDIPY